MNTADGVEPSNSAWGWEQEYFYLWTFGVQESHAPSSWESNEANLIQGVLLETSLMYILLEGSPFSFHWTYCQESVKIASLGTPRMLT